MYNTLAYPYLVYCIALWGNSYNLHLNTVIRAQKRLVRIMDHKSKYAHTSPIFKSLNLLNFHLLYEFNLVLTVFKHLKCIESQTIFSRFEHIHNTRGNNVNIPCPQVRTTFVEKSILCNGPRIWNSLPSSLKSLESIKSFKSNSKKFFFSKL